MDIKLIYTALKMSLEVDISYFSLHYTYFFFVKFTSNFGPAPINIYFCVNSLSIGPVTPAASIFSFILQMLTFLSLLLISKSIHLRKKGRRKHAGFGNDSECRKEVYIPTHGDFRRKTRTREREEPCAKDDWYKSVHELLLQVKVSQLKKKKKTFLLYNSPFRHLSYKNGRDVGKDLYMRMFIWF